MCNLSIDFRELVFNKTSKYVGKGSRPILEYYNFANEFEEFDTLWYCTTINVPLKKTIGDLVTYFTRNTGGLFIATLGTFRFKTRCDVLEKNHCNDSYEKIHRSRIVKCIYVTAMNFLKILR